MGKKSFMNVGKVFTMLAICMLLVTLFAGCGKIKKIFMSDKKIESRFSASMMVEFVSQNEPYLDSIFVEDVKITDTDGDNYKLDIKLSCGSGKYKITVKGTGFFDGDDLSWEIPGSELEKACAIRVQQEISTTLAASGTNADAVEIKVENTKGLNYTYSIFLNGKNHTGVAWIDKASGKVNVL